MSTNLADEGGIFSTPLTLPDEEIRRLAREAARRLWALLVSSPEPAASYTVSAPKQDAASTTATGKQEARQWRIRRDGLTELLSDLASLLQRQDYDEDFVKPTDEAFSKAWDLLNDAGVYVGENFPLGTIYPFGNGGLRIEWIGTEKELRLSISPAADEQSYIYYEHGEHYAPDYNVSAINLAKWLRWFKDNDRGAR